MEATNSYKKLDLSIITVTWNCEAFIERFVRELRNSLLSYCDYELLVYDNASTDKTVSLLRQAEVEVEASPHNIGFAAANNHLIRQSRYENILLLNPDVFGFSQSFWADLFRRWDRSNPIFIKLLNEDGSYQDCVGEVLSIRRFIRKLIGKVDYESIRTKTEVGMGIMAFMLVTRHIFETVGLLDERYHMYGEDMDWCCRAGKQGYKIVYEPELSLYHLGGGSAVTRWKAIPLKLTKIRSEQLFLNSHYIGVERYFLNTLVKAKHFYYKRKLGRMI